MRKVLFAVALITLSSAAQSAALCQSLRDPNFQAWFEGYNCPAGYYLIRIK